MLFFLNTQITILILTYALHKIMIMKKLLILAMLTLTGGSFVAQSGTKYSDKDPKAKAILDKINKKYKAYKTISIDFEVSLKGEGVNETIKGKAFKQGNKYAYDTEDYKVVCDGKSVWTYVKDDNQVTITSLDDAAEDDETQMLNPTKLVSIWEKGFKYKMGTSTTVAGKKVKLIKLYPDQPKKYKFHTISLYVDDVKSEIVKIKVKGRDGVNMEYNLKKLKGDEAIPASKFKFDKSKYPGIEENDMRF